MPTFCRWVRGLINSVFRRAYSMQDQHPTGRIPDLADPIEVFRQRFLMAHPATFEIFVRVEELINSVHDHRPQSDIGRAQRAFMRRTANAMYAVSILVQYGAPFDALILVRSMFEFMVASEYLKVHPESLELFIKFEAVEKFKWARNLVAAGVLTEDKFSDYEGMRAAWEAVRSDFPDKSYWTGKKLPETVKACDNESLRTLYELLYPRVSKFVHPSPTGLADQLDETGHNIGLYPVDFESDTTLELAIMATIAVLANYDASESLGIGNILNELNETLRHTNVPPTP